MKFKLKYLIPFYGYFAYSEEYSKAMSVLHCFYDILVVILLSLLPEII